jgi:putative redox protein
MADVEVSLRWTGKGLEFKGGAEGGPVVRIDGDKQTGASPMQALLLAIAGCMGADIVNILAKMRVRLDGLEIRLEGDRAADPPRRYTRIRLVCESRGVPAADEPKLRRAVDLSRDTYCSVMHSLRTDLEIETEVVLG